MKRRLSPFAFVAAVGLLASAGEPSGAAQAAPTPVKAAAVASARIAAVGPVEVVVRDLARSVAFYATLGFAPGPERELGGPDADARTGLRGVMARRVELTLGSEHLALLQFTTPADGRPVPHDTHGNDLWFQHVAIVVSDMERAYAWLRAHHVSHVSSGPQTLPRWNHAAGGIQAFYFADPDGHTLELIHFPRGKGDPRWQSATACRRAPVEHCLFLGIDHTAIAVEDTDHSLQFYRDRLGLRVAGESENYGPEQEHLNGVFGARLRITALRAGAGPGIELLEYLAPRSGRPMPADVHANDLFHWQVTVQTDNVAGVADAALATGGRRIGKGAAREVMVRDRDGHALLARSADAP